MIQKLYYEMPYVKSFMCTVVSCQPGKKGYDVVLNQTAFYPEGGGQPGDTGTLAGIPVLDVHERDGQIVHQLLKPIETGSLAEGIVDWERRFDYMQQHTGEHILSGLIHQRFGYNNVGFHMGTQEVTIDFDGPMTLQEAEEMENAANQVVFQNLPVKVWYPGAEELKAIPYRSKKELSGEVRIVEIPQADICACCGTHVESTGEVGLIKITSIMNYKGGVRMTMVCGGRALSDFGRKQKQILKISNLLSVKAGEVAEAVEKQKEESQARAYLAVKLYRELFDAWSDLYPEQDQPLFVIKEDLAPIQLRELCTALYQKKRGNAVLVCSEKDGRYQYALGSEKVDIKELSKRLNTRLNGRGGGSGQIVQGNFNGTKEEIETAFLEEMNGIK